MPYSFLGVCVAEIEIGDQRRAAAGENAARIIMVGCRSFLNCDLT